MRVRIIAVVAVLAALSASAAGETRADVEARYSREYARCMDRSELNDFNMRECAIAEYTRQDRHLNILYWGLMRRLDARGRSDLRKRQLAWIKARDARCRSEMRAAGDGTLSLVVASECHLQRTTERVIYLEKEARARAR